MPGKIQRATYEVLEENYLISHETKDIQSKKQKVPYGLTKYQLAEQIAFSLKKSKKEIYDSIDRAIRRMQHKGFILFRRQRYYFKKESFCFIDKDPALLNDKRKPQQSNMEQIPRDDSKIVCSENPPVYVILESIVEAINTLEKIVNKTNLKALILTAILGKPIHSLGTLTREEEKAFKDLGIKHPEYEIKPILEELDHENPEICSILQNPYMRAEIALPSIFTIKGLIVSLDMNFLQIFREAYLKASLIPEETETIYLINEKDIYEYLSNLGEAFHALKLGKEFKKDAERLIGCMLWGNVINQEKAGNYLKERSRYPFHQVWLQPASN